MLLHAKHFSLERDGGGSVASMPQRVVPSEIVSVIDRSFPWAAQASGMRSSGGPDFVQVFALSGVVELLDRLLDELLIFDEQAFAMFLVARAALRQMRTRSSASSAFQTCGSARKRTSLTGCGFSRNSARGADCGHVQRVNH
jgi:hypothetical protein